MSEKKENTVMGMETTAVPVESANTTVMQKEAATAGQPHPKIEVELSPHDDFVLDIAVGKNRNQKNWKPYKITFKQLKERLAKTVYTDETMAQYATFSRTKQGEIKDVGGMVMAVLKGGHRGKQDVLSRSAITLDIDYGVPGIEDVLDFTTDFAGIIYSTHKHKPEAPRLRLVIPLSRSVTAEEYVAIARKVAEEIDIEMFDDTTYEPNRLMYWPSISKDGVYVYRELHGDLLNPDNVLAKYKNWRDVSEYPVSSRQTKIVQHLMQKQKDPLTKNNLIGAFCQAYDIPSVIGSFLNEVYEPTASPDRYSYGKNTVLGLYPLLPENVEVDRDESGELYYIYHAYTDEVPGEQNKDLYFRWDEIFHVPGLGFNGLIGFSPIAMMKNSLGTSIAVDKYGSSFFKNGAQPSGVLEHHGVVKDPNRIRDSWEAAYGGAANAHRVAVLEEGMAYKPISLPPEDSQFLETKQFSVTEICRIFRVPPHLVADLSRATFSNIEYQSLNFVMQGRRDRCPEGRGVF